ncbi:phosphatase 2C-like domain-containing protein [Kockovaella imperatae]|uniref:Phosphatase 2C-like domain-containing protein n=1 Tax=Kockovaella imperatae TaxID=4999 RepID=A0A1Y1UJ83_9TREE|nr:phosphatase 2C-like domain-containing protein [Kockovaella imperatae]ORX38042.1 phosphatase 2C-like domain-containing protein [Kockovaella imperatae]
MPSSCILTDREDNTAEFIPLSDDLVEFKFTIAEEGYPAPPPSKHILVSKEQFNATLKRGEVNKTASSVTIQGNCLGYSPAAIGNEDRIASDVISSTTKLDGAFWPAWSGTKSTEDGDLIFASVFDGHAGSATSELLSKTLHACLAKALLASGLDDEAEVKAVIEETYAAWDEDLMKTLRAALSESSASPSTLAGAMGGMAGFSGSCALTVIVDKSHDRIYAINLGDCRAVAGWHGPNGWKCDPLTEDLNANNPNEVERMRAEHPEEERDDIVVKTDTHRVLATIMVSRAFGDFLFKMPSDEYKSLKSAFNVVQKEPKRPVKTPPYVSNKPEIAVRSFKQGEETLKFIVLASDGLWDRLTSEQSVQLMAARSDGEKEITRQELVKTYPMDNEAKHNESDHDFIVGDDANAATHLIRNVYGGSNEMLGRSMLSVLSEEARMFRDDISVQVLSFN